MATYYGTYDPVLAKDLVTFFNLNPDEKISHLSKGNTAKVNLLLGLTLNSDYLIMDEPFSRLISLLGKDCQCIHQ